MQALERPDSGRILYSGFFEDFDHFVTADRWTVVATDSGTAVVQDEAGGVINLAASDGTEGDNDEIYLHTTKEIFKIESGRPILIEARVKFTEANTDDANIMFGLMNGIAANALVDNGAGPKADYSGAVFFKADGDTVWSVENSDSTTQKTTQLDGSHVSVIGSNFASEAQTAGGGVWETLRIEVRPTDAGKANFIFWKDGAPVAKHTDQVFTNATEAAVVLGVKNGGTNVETLAVDYVSAWQKRA